MILLDTHVWIWANMEPERISAAALRSLEADTDLAISSVTVWEAMLLLEKGRVQYDLPPADAVRTWLEAAPWRVIALDAEAAILARTLAFLTRTLPIDSSQQRHSSARFRLPLQIRTS